MSSAPFDRRRLLRALGSGAVVTAASGSPGRSTTEAAVSPGAAVPAAVPAVTQATPFALGQVQLTAGRWLDSQNRTTAYLRFVDVDRLLHAFRANHRLPAQGAAPDGGGAAPNFPFRGHVQGLFLTAWAQAWAATGDTTCRDRAATMVAELARCQANNAAAGFATGYLSGFPESAFTEPEAGRPGSTPGGTPVSTSWYGLHKTLAGLLDVWQLTGSAQAKDVLLALAGWVDARTGRWGGDRMQPLPDTGFGGMNDVLAALSLATNDSRWLRTAQRFDHAADRDPLAALDPLAARDPLAGLHADTLVPQWIGAVKEYRATGSTRYRDLATNAWNLVVGAHPYDLCESCTTHDLLELTRELFQLDPDRVDLADFSERALLNQLIGQQDPADDDSFWCCRGTGLETRTKLMDSIYFFGGTTLIVNLFTPSVLNWTQRGITVTQTTTFPVSDTTTLTVTGSVAGTWSMRVRVPCWTSGATISVNGVVADVAGTPGTYATVTRSWTSGDTVTVRLPMGVVLRAADDDPGVSAITYGPVVLAGDHGDATLDALPTLDPDSITRTSSTALAFTASADGATVPLVPFHDAQHLNHTVYWGTEGSAGGPTPRP